MILFVDDEPYYVRSYIEELSESGFEVVHREGVGAAMKFCEDHFPEIAIVITDVMMVPSGRFHGDTAYGLRTGFAFYDWIRQRAPNLPIMILTNVDSPDVDQKISTDPNCRVFRKSECLPSELATYVRQIVPL